MRPEYFHTITKPIGESISLIHSFLFLHTLPICFFRKIYTVLHTVLFQGFLTTILPDKGKILIEIIVFHILHHTKPLAYVNKFAMMDASQSYHLPSLERNQVSFTLEEAKALIGYTLQVKMQEPFEIHDDIVLHPDQEGTIIGVSGEYTEEGIPELSIAIQFWPTDEESVPVITLVEKSAFTTHFSLTGKQP